MNDRTARQFEAADAATEKAVADFIGKIEGLFGKWEVVEPKYIVETMALALCAEVGRLIDKRQGLGPATLALSNALADYRDSRFEDR